MSELRELANAVEHLFKEVCKVKSSPHLHIDSVKIELGKALSQLSWGAAEQEALSPAPQTQKPGGITWVEDADYKSALSAPPDFEGEWQWVPKGYVIVPEKPTKEMIEAGKSAQWLDIDSWFPVYNHMLAARPPVPKKGERV